MSTKPVPEWWAKRMAVKRYSHRGEPSISALARAADLSVETTRRFIHRIGEAEAATVAALSEAIGEDVAWWVGGKPVGELYTGPDQSRYLDERQRLALTEIINAFVKGDSDVGKSAQKTPGLESAEPAMPLGSDQPPRQAPGLRSLPTGPDLPRSR